MMVKSVKQLNRGQFKLKKKKVWIPVENSNEGFLEMEIEVIDLSNYSITIYDKKAKIVLKEKKELSTIDLYV